MSTPDAADEAATAENTNDDEADDLRLRGNHEFSEGRYDAALMLYTSALQCCADGSSNKQQQQQQRAVLLCNRSATYFQQEEYELAARDAQTAWQLSASAKAAFRLAKTQLALKQLQSAQETIQSALVRLQNSAETTATTAAETKGQRKALEDLLIQVQAASQQEPPDDEPPETSIKFVKRPIRIREFTKQQTLGHGNFSEIVVVQHKQTGERFALKMIAKKQAADLAKRQHPNVYHEIQMERRVLLERLPAHPFIIHMYHAFQDYNTLYYLMELHTEWSELSDLWSELQWDDELPEEEDGGNVKDHPNTKRKKKHMVGCHRSQAVWWIFQLVDALEHLHSHGIVHRDLKTENVQLSARGHVVLLDFGTAKDLLQTDLNGPEFVGTPDFMSPEAVSGASGMQEAAEAVQQGEVGAVHTADLWALGAMLYIMQTGMTPFWCPSQYLAFLKIKRGNLMRPTGIVDYEAWDLIQKLMQMEPAKRLGADAFELVVDGNKRRIERKSPHGYDMIRNHPYFASCHGIETKVRDETPIPSLRDLCVRSVAVLAHQDSMDVDLCEMHPPGDGSRHDMTRLSARDRAAVMHVLDRRQLLRDPRLYARFFEDPAASRLQKVRPATHDFVGLTQMNDDQGKAPHAVMNDPYAKPIPMDDIGIVQIISPLFHKKRNESCDEATRKVWFKLFKKCVATVNRKRPKLVVACGYMDERCRKLLSRISESIPVAVHDVSTFFTVWCLGVQFLLIQSSSSSGSSNSSNLTEDSAQVSWLREHMEQCRMSKHPLFAFIDGDPRDLPAVVSKRLARGRVLSLFGQSLDATISTTVSYAANERVPLNDNDDAISLNSVDSGDDEEDEKDDFTMKVEVAATTGLRWIRIGQEPGDWSSELETIELPSDT